jgi:arsenical pump membrane protein
VVVAIAQQSGLSPIPFAFVTVWIANTGSLFLPVSNLTNLLAFERLGGPSAIEYLARAELPATVAVLVTVMFAWVVFRKHLVGVFTTRPSAAEPDRPLLVASAGILAVALIGGAPFWLASTIAMLALVALFAMRRPRTLSVSLVPWSLLLFASGLFLAAEGVHQWFLARLLDGLDSQGDGSVPLLTVAGAGLLGANLIDNLPAYLLLEPLAATADRVLVLLVGVNAGAIITPWASLATLLWHSRMESLGVTVPWRTYVKYGLVLAPLTVVAASLAVAL